MSKILIVHTSWYEENINRMIHISSETLKENDYLFDVAVAPGAIELAALAKHKLLMNEGRYVGVIFLGEVQGIDLMVMKILLHYQVQILII